MRKNFEPMTVYRDEDLLSEARSGESTDRSYGSKMQPLLPSLESTLSRVSRLTSQQHWCEAAKRVQSPISVGFACRAGIRGHAATSASRGRKDGYAAAWSGCATHGGSPCDESPFRQKGPTLTIIRDYSVQSAGSRIASIPGKRTTWADQKVSEW